MTRRLLMSFVLMCSLLANLSGQQPQQPSPSASPVPSPGKAPAPPKLNVPRDDDQEVVRITTNLVQVDAVVTKDGKQVTDLKAEDFEIFEDGKPQTITQFSYVSNVPESVAISNVTTPGPRDKNGPPIVPVTARPNEVRRTIALVVDDLGISHETMYLVRRQLRKYLDEQLQPNDLVSILETGGSEIGALQQFTTDKRLLNSAVDRLRWNPCSRVGISIFRPVSPLADPTGGTSLCAESPFRTLRSLRFFLQGMSDLPGRKSMVIFSDSMPIEEQDMSNLAGGPLDPARAYQGVGDTKKNDDPGIGNQTGDKTGERFSASSMTAQLHRIAELAIRSSVVIYAVDSRGLVYTGPTAADNFNRPESTLRETIQNQTTVLNARADILARGREGGQLIASETGGFAVYNTNDLGLRRVMDDQRGYYLIGYRPRDETFDKRFHHIKVRTKGRGFEVRTRKGFYGVTEDEANPPPLTARDQMNKALMSPFGASDVTVRLTTIFGNDPAQGSLLRSLLYLDARDLVFAEQPDGTREATFDLSTIIFGDYGKVIGRQDGPVKLRLKPARYEQVMREGIVYKFDTPIKKAGAFQFRVALHDTGSTRIGAAGQFVEVPNLLNKRLAISGILLGGAGSSGDALSQGPAVRRFQAGAQLSVAYVVYNALIESNTRVPQLSAQARIFRDGKLVYSGQATPIAATGQTDLQRISAVTQLGLDRDLSPGDYVLQVIVEDRLAKEKQGTVSQWIDFTVVN